MVQAAQSKLRPKIILISRSLLFLSILFSISLSIIQDGGFGMLLYYTILSNLLVLIFTGYLLYKQLTGRKFEDQTTLRLKGGVVMSIMITMVIYHFMLAPIASASDFWRVQNLLNHYINPLWFILDTIIFDAPRQYKKTDPILWTIVPFLYLGFALINGLILKWPIPDAKNSPFAYFFLDVNKYGWNFVIGWVIKIIIGYLAVGYLFYFVKQIRFTKKANDL